MCAEVPKFSFKKEIERRTEVDAHAPQQRQVHELDDMREGAQQVARRAPVHDRRVAGVGPQAVHLVPGRDECAWEGGCTRSKI